MLRKARALSKKPGANNLPQSNVLVWRCTGTGVCSRIRSKVSSANQLNSLVWIFMHFRGSPETIGSLSSHQQAQRPPCASLLLDSLRPEALHHQHQPMADHVIRAAIGIHASQISSRKTVITHENKKQEKLQPGRVRVENCRFGGRNRKTDVS